jgi:pimeloyl-ACP methyl ester carboxylesterase
MKGAAKVGATIAFVCLLVAGSGFAYSALSIRHYRNVSGIPGMRYDIGGHWMHLHCTGAGTPTIVLSSGLGDDFTSWARVQPVLSKQTRVCAYDRAGFGWSDARSEVQDAGAVALQLHELLRSAGVARPFLLVGHSISGVYLRAYAAQYPEDLAGLVFVDGATPLQDDRIPKELVRIQEEQRRQMPWQKLLMAIGWYRIQGLCTSLPPGSEAYAAWIKADSCIPAQIDAMANELDAQRASGAETIHAGPFNDLPILILSRDPTVLPSNWPAAVSKANAVVWNQMQEEAKGLSAHSRRIIAKGSDHYIQNDRPDLVNREIGSFLEMIRNHQLFPDTGPTTEE